MDPTLEKYMIGLQTGAVRKCYLPPCSSHPFLVTTNFGEVTFVVVDHVLETATDAVKDPIDLLRVLGSFRAFMMACLQNFYARASSGKLQRSC